MSTVPVTIPILFKFIEFSRHGGCTRSKDGTTKPSTQPTPDTLVKGAEQIIRALTPSLSQKTSVWEFVLSIVADEPLTIVIASSPEDQPLGMAIIRQYENTVNGNKFQLEGIHVDPKHRSKGIGSAIMDYLKLMASSVGSTSIITIVDTLNFDASRFFMKQRMNILCFGFTAPTTPRISSSVSAIIPSSVSPEPSPSPTPLPGFVVGHVTNSQSKLTLQGEALLRAAEPVHRQLRPMLPAGTEAYIARMKRIFQDGGRMVVAIERNDDPNAPLVALGVGVYRYYTTFDTRKKRNWVDDLVTDSQKRSSGVGHAIVDVIREDTRDEGVEFVQLDSGVPRRDAHRFYYREQFIIDAYTFGVALTPIANSK